MASRYILRAIMISPRRSGVSGVASAAGSTACGGLVLSVKACVWAEAIPPAKANRKVNARCLRETIKASWHLFKHTPDTAEKALFRLFLRLVLRLSHGRRRRRAVARQRRRIGARGRCQRGRLRKALLRRGLPTRHVRHGVAAAVQRAGALRLGAGNVHLGASLRAVRRGRIARGGIDLHGDDPIRRLERFHVAVWTVLQRALHELGPDGERGV